MNLRILKKLSKRAAPFLVALGDHREQFRAEKNENYMGVLIRERKHFERGRSVHADLLRQGEIKRRAKDGRGFVYAAPPSHPRKGTVMVGGMSGGETPEWDEETAWEALHGLVYWSFGDIEGDDWKPSRPLRNPSEIFHAANDLIGASP